MIWTDNKCTKPNCTCAGSGEQINADALRLSDPGSVSGATASSAPSTAPQEDRLHKSPAISSEPATAVPDDPVAVYEDLKSYRQSSADAIRALAAHYEAKGMRRAAEFVQSNALVFSCCQNGCRLAEAILAAAAKQEADR